MQRHSRCLVSVIVALVLLMSPSAAIGQEPGVTFDDGPSSKEYAIPLDAARNQTKTKRPSAKAPAPAPARKTARSAPSTGGVTAADEPKPKRSTKDKRETKTTTTQDDALAAVLPDPPRATQARVAEPVSADGTGAGVVIGGLALAALALGGLAGLVLRRRSAAVDEP